MNAHVKVTTGGDIDCFKHLYDACSFIKTTPTRREFWAVESTGDYAEDIEVGVQCGLELLGVLRRSDCDHLTRSTLLSWTLIAMMEKGATVGHLIGLAKVLTRALPRR